MPRLNDRLDALERAGDAHALRPLPEVLPDTATDAEIAEIRRAGADAYRESDLDLYDLFI